MNAALAVADAALVRRPRVALVAPSLDILGGHGVQAAELVAAFAAKDWTCASSPSTRASPGGSAGSAGAAARTLLNQALYLPSLARLRHADVVHVFSASYWSFLLAPVPAMLAARAFGAPRRPPLPQRRGRGSPRRIGAGSSTPGCACADEIVVPSEYLREVFARHGYRARVIPNVIDTTRFRFRERRAAAAPAPLDAQPGALLRRRHDPARLRARCGGAARTRP